MSRANRRFIRNNPSLNPVGGTAGVVLYKIWGTLEGQETISTFYYYSTVPAPTQVQLTSLLTSISGVMFAGYKGAVSADWACVKETLDVVHRNDIIGQQSLANAATVGARAAGHAPTEMAMVLNRYSFIKGQHGRGRVSLPAPSLTDITNSKIASAGGQAALNAVASNMLLTGSDGTNTWTPCIAQRATTPPKLVTAISALTKVIPNFLLGTVRRRKIGRGK